MLKIAPSMSMTERLYPQNNDVTVLPTHIARGSLLLYGEAAGENIGIVL